MNRRHFIALSGTASVAALSSTSPTVRAAESSSGPDYYQLRQFIIESMDQKKKLDSFLKDAAIPAMNRIGIKPVGAFYPAEGLSPVYMLLRHRTIESVATLLPELAADQEFMSKGADFINAPASEPAYKRMEDALLLAFKGMPQIETPILSAGRVLQLRIYESPSVK